MYRSARAGHGHLWWQTDSLEYVVELLLTDLTISSLWDYLFHELIMNPSASGAMTKLKPKYLIQKLPAEKFKRTEATMAMNYVGRALHYPRGRCTSDLREGHSSGSIYILSSPHKSSSILSNHRRDTAEQYLPLESRWTRGRRGGCRLADFL